MARELNRRSATKLGKAKPGMHPDRGGLYRRVTAHPDGKFRLLVLQIRDRPGDHEQERQSSA